MAAATFCQICILAHIGYHSTYSYSFMLVSARCDQNSLGCQSIYIGEAKVY